MLRPIYREEDIIFRELRELNLLYRFEIIEANKLTYRNLGKFRVGCCLGPGNSVIHSLLNHDTKKLALENLKIEFELGT